MAYQLKVAWVKLDLYFVLFAREIFVSEATGILSFKSHIIYLITFSGNALFQTF